MHERISPCYNQSVLIDKLNLYFAKFNRQQWHSGFCHGLNLVWQQKMRDRMEEKFYAVKKRIINCPVDKLHELDDDIDVQKFIAQVEFAQHSIHYDVGIGQKNIDLILETSKPFHHLNYYSAKSFAKLLDKLSPTKPSTTIMSKTGEEGKTRSNHSVGIVYRDNKYYVFDANYDEGEAKIFDQSIDAAREMISCMYESFNLKCPRWMTLEIFMVETLSSPPMIKKVSTQTNGFFSTDQKIKSNENNSNKMIPALA